MCPLRAARLTGFGLRKHDTRRARSSDQSGGVAGFGIWGLAIGEQRAREGEPKRVLCSPVLSKFMIAGEVPRCFISRPCTADNRCLFSSHHQLDRFSKPTCASWVGCKLRRRANGQSSAYRNGSNSSYLASGAGTNPRRFREKGVGGGCRAFGTFPSNHAPRLVHLLHSPAGIVTRRRPNADIEKVCAASC